MVFLTPNPSRVLAACCKVEVIKGAEGLDLVGLSSRLSTEYWAGLSDASATSA